MSTDISDNDVLILTTSDEAASFTAEGVSEAFEVFVTSDEALFMAADGVSDVVQLPS